MVTKSVAETAVGIRGVREGGLLWTPSAAQIEDANFTRFAKWLARERELHVANYDSLWRWSVTELPFLKAHSPATSK